MNEDVEEIKPELARAVGLVAMTDAPLGEVASAAGISLWELERCLESSSLAETLDVETEGDVGDEIDRLLDEHSP